MSQPRDGRRKRVVHEWDWTPRKGHPSIRTRVVIVDDAGPTHAGVWLYGEHLLPEEDALGTVTQVWNPADNQGHLIAEAMLALVDKIELLDAEVKKLEETVRARFH